MDAMMYDLYMPKSSILLAYCNTAYFGNHIQGLKTASKAYFNKSPEKLSTEEIVQLLGTLSDPSFDNPLSESNIRKSRILAKQLGVQTVDQSFASPDTVKQNLSSFQEKEDSFELRPYIQSMKDMPKEIKTSIDSKLTTNVRQILGSIVPSLSDRDAHNMAIVIMKLPENEILTFIGSPDPTGISYGQQINMLQEPRQVASTIKPLVYAKAFEMGARPYTLIDDEEYEYKTDDGQSFYLRNYDGKFHGRITAAYALDNSINIPAVKTLSFVGVDHFADFLSTLGYADTKKVHALGIGAALGTIDMTLPDLAHLYTIFPNQGKLNSMHLFSDQSLNSSFFPQSSRQVIEPQYTQLVTKILSDRHLATDQFGYRSDLNIPLDNYALKTGTSDDYHDSWVIGFTPDFLVGVWVGNADNKSTKRLSGQSGAGEIWSQVMELMSHSTYNKKTPFAFDKIRPIGGTTNSAYEISGDDIEKARDLFIDSK